MHKERVLQITHLLLGDTSPFGLITVTRPQLGTVTADPEEIERTQFLQDGSWTLV